VLLGLNSDFADPGHRLEWLSQVSAGTTVRAAPVGLSAETAGGRIRNASTANQTLFSNAIPSGIAAVVLAATDKARSATVARGLTLRAARLPAAATDTHRPIVWTAVVVAIWSTARAFAGTAIRATARTTLLVRTTESSLGAGHVATEDCYRWRRFALLLLFLLPPGKDLFGVRFKPERDRGTAERRE